jgi:hypothetical protein
MLCWIIVMEILSSHLYFGSDVTTITVTLHKEELACKPQNVYKGEYVYSQ